MKTEHTPGPWSRADSVVVTTMETHHYMTWIANCSVGGAGSSEQLANARLVAAAPELLEAAEAFVKLCEQSGWSITPDSPAGKARAAIAKAKGAES